MNFKYFFTLIILLISSNCFSQTTAELRQNEYGKTIFEIADIQVTGASYASKKNIIARSGLQIGQKINLKSGDVSEAIQNLMKSNILKSVAIDQVKVVNDLIFLKINIVEFPVLKYFSIRNVNNSEEGILKKLLKKYLEEGRVFNHSHKGIVKKLILSFFEKRGFLNATLDWNETPCPHEKNCNRIVIKINKNKRIRIFSLSISGNKIVSEKKLLKLMETKSLPQLFKRTYFIHEIFKQDKVRIISYYNSLGYLDAKIIEERIIPQKNGFLNIELVIQEGEPYFFGDITWRGNYKYSTEVLDEILGIKKGDIFNEILLLQKLNFNDNGLDISQLYMDDGHLFFQIKPVKTALNGNQFDVEIQIIEGDETTIRNIIIRGNDVTSENVIRRELRSIPGDKFNREDILRSQRVLIHMGYFAPESVTAIPHLNPEDGTVDIVYNLKEKRSDRYEFSGLWGGEDVGVVGTAGFQLSNFSLRKFLIKEGWKPLPRGGGQSLGLRIQYGGKEFQSYNFSFSEPWLNGKPSAFSYGIFFNKYQDDGQSNKVFDEVLSVFGANIKFGRRLKVWKEFILTRTGLNFQNYILNNWTSGLFQTDDGELISEGQYFNINISQEFTRTTLNHPIYPTSGSRVSLKMQFTPPYSLIEKRSRTNPVEKEFQLVEYHKWRLDVEKYIPAGGNLTLKFAARMGFLGNYNNGIGTTPFERFQLGGDALSNSQLGYTGTDRITMRGYRIEDFETNIQNGQIVATPIFNKFTVELRHPFSLNPKIGGYGFAFFEAGNSWGGFDTYQPLDLKRAAGIGLRLRLPKLGTLGVDYGIGFDNAKKWTFRNLGRWNVTLGVELD